MGFVPPEQRGQGLNPSGKRSGNSYDDPEDQREISSAPTLAPAQYSDPYGDANTAGNVVRRNKPKGIARIYNGLHRRQGNRRGSGRVPWF
jgi:hypothetical protein